MQMAPTRRLIYFGSPAAYLLRTTTLPAEDLIPTTLAPASMPAHKIFDLPVGTLTARFLTNGRLTNEKTGLERARAMAQ